MTNTRIISHGYVLTCDPENRGGFLHLVIRDGVIVELSPDLEELEKRYHGATLINARGKLLTPGFVNAHCHSDSFLHRRYTDGRHYLQWSKAKEFEKIQRLLIEAESRRDIGALYHAAYCSHLRAGTTTVGEFPPPVDDKGLITVLQEIERSEVLGVVSLQNWDQISAARDLGEGRPPMNISLGKEGEYTVYSFESILNASRSTELPVVAHLAELKDDADVIRRNFQKNPLTLLAEYAVFERGTTILHGNYLTDNDVALVQAYGVPLVITPRSTAFKQTGYPSLKDMMNANVFMSFGTDWGRFDLLGEMQFFSHLTITLPGFQQHNSMQLLRMATINGAHALGVERKVGSLEVGKRADIVFFSIDSLRIPPPDLSPTAIAMADVLLRYLHTGDITSVMVRGEFGLHDRQLVISDEQEIRKSAEQLMRKYYPAPLSEKPQIQPPKVISFVQTPSSEAVDGFEKGRPPREETAILEMPPVPSEYRKPALQKKPQLPKDVRKVFGDDDDA